MALGGGGSEALEHVEGCDACAELFADYVWIGRSAQRVAGRTAPERDVSPVSRVHPSVRRWAVAAALLIAVAGAAVGAAHFFVSAVFLTSPNAGLGRVAEVEARVGLDYAAAGVGAEAVVDSQISFILAPDAFGTIAVTRSTTDNSQDVHGFGAHGEHFWSAHSAWGEHHDATLNFPAARVIGTLTQVTRAEPDSVEETLCIVLGRRYDGALLMVDPRTGTVLGSFFHGGSLAADINTEEAIAVLPAATGEERTLLVCGRHGAGPDAVPCVTILTVRGEALQHVIFPSIGLGGGAGSRLVQAKVDWNPERASVQFLTSDSLLFFIALRDGRLAINGATCAVPDDFHVEFKRRKGEEAYAKLLDEDGGLSTYLAEQRAKVRDDPLEELQAWKRR